jgi:hypothetical protein
MLGYLVSLGLVGLQRTCNCLRLDAKEMTSYFFPDCGPYLKFLGVFFGEQDVLGKNDSNVEMF